MTLPELETAVRQVIRHGPQLARLADFASDKHGFGDSDGGFGIIYPGDLDEYDRDIDGRQIPTDWVEVYGFWGSPDGYEFLIREQDYLKILASVLTESGYSAEALKVRSLFE